MTGPDHYRYAERLMSPDTHAIGGGPGDREIAQAQVHATLALAAATATSGATGPGHSWHLALRTTTRRKP